MRSLAIAPLIFLCTATSHARAESRLDGVSLTAPRSASQAEVVQARIRELLSPTRPAGWVVPTTPTHAGGNLDLGSCPCSGTPLEVEGNCGLPTDSVNGGCNYSPNNFGTISLPGSGCGTCAWDGATRDLDWYRFTVSSTTQVTATVNAQFLCDVFLVTDVCPTSVITSNFGGPCTPVSTVANLTPGTYVVVVAPDFGGPVVACGGNDDYSLSLTTGTPTTPPNDDCATPSVIGGPGPFSFDTTNATTGTAGQNEANCFFFGTPGIDLDLWYKWTAPSTGTVTLSACGLTSNLDTKVAVYPFTGACPANGTSIACNDDFCGLISELNFAATASSQYLIQVGHYPGSIAGAGAFAMTFTPQTNGCAIDDGVSEDTVGLGGFGGGEQLCLNRFGAPGTVSTVESISMCWGSPAAPGFAPAVGTAAQIRIFRDTNGNGQPDDLNSEVDMEPTVVHAVDGDLYGQTAFRPPAPVLNGYYFVGVSVVAQSGEFPTSFDFTTPSGGRGWIVGAPGGSIDYTNLPANAVYGENSSLGIDGVYLIRADCSSDAKYTTMCEPGTNALPCPCGNPPAGAGVGCNNFTAFSGGAGLAAGGVASLGVDTLTLNVSNENNTALTVFWQGTVDTSPGVISGAGVSCVNGVVKRLYVGNASFGALTKPTGADPSVSAVSASMGDPISAGQYRYYFTTYRDPNAATPCGVASSTFNVSSAVKVHWAN